MDTNDAEARDHHYRFVHEQLPQLIWREPDYAEFLLDPRTDGAGFLQELWSDLGTALLPENERVPAAGLHLDRRELSNGYQVAVVTLPQPEFYTEAYMVAIALRNAPGQTAIIRYFTLELGEFFEPQPRRGTFFCDRTADGEHRNYGEGPPPDIDAFCEAIRIKIEEQTMGAGCA